AFLWSSLLLIFILAFPRVGTAAVIWPNGLYDSLSIILLFPLVVYLGASGKIKGQTFLSLCRFLGNISYPLYIIHYPFIYIFSAWVVNNNISLSAAWPVGLATLVAVVTLAYIIVKFYDLPVRKWLAAKFINK